MPKSHLGTLDYHMAAEYQDPDWRVVDYQAYCLDERIIDPSTKRPLRIRGPRPRHLERDSYFVCLGAAQTFGRFCARPFPTLLGERLGMAALNISHGGAGPSFFSGKDERLIGYLNGARFVILQVMSGRSESNSLFISEGVGHYTRRSDGTVIGCDEAFAKLIRGGPLELLERVVAETRANWCVNFAALMNSIRVPRVLLWFSTRTPEYAQRWSGVKELFGDFPQLVNRQMLDNVSTHCERTLEVVTKRGMPQILRDRFTGRRTVVADRWTSGEWRENWYYPSPEMHEDAASGLEPVCRSLLNDAGFRCAALDERSRK